MVSQQGSGSDACWQQPYCMAVRLSTPASSPAGLHVRLSTAAASQHSVHVSFSRCRHKVWVVLLLVVAGAMPPRTPNCQMRWQPRASGSSARLQEPWQHWETRCAGLGRQRLPELLHWLWCRPACTLHVRCVCWPRLNCEASVWVFATPLRRCGRLARPSWLRLLVCPPWPGLAQEWPSALRSAMATFQQTSTTRLVQQQQ